MKIDLNDMVGRRITVDGERTRVAKVLKTKGILVNEDGTRVSVDDVYKRGPGFFADTEAKKTSTTKSKKAKPKAKPKAEQAEEPRSRRIPRGRKAKTDKSDKKAKRKQEQPPVGRIDQTLAAKIAQAANDKFVEHVIPALDWGLQSVAVGATFDESSITLNLTLMSSDVSAKDIKKFIQDNRQMADIAPADEEEDDDLEDDDAEDADLDEEEEDDTDLEDDYDEEEEDDDEEEEDLDEEEDEYDSYVDAVLEVAPSLDRDKVAGYVAEYFNSDEIEENIGDELTPGESHLHEKGKKLLFLLVGFDGENVRLLNLKTLKFRSKTISEVVRMEIAEV